MRNALFWMSLPFLLPQALRLRRTAPRVSGAAGVNHGTVGKGPERSLLVFGDSIAAGVGARDFPRSLVGRTADALARDSAQTIRWSAEGYIGANSDKILDRLNGRGHRETVDYLVLSVGVNDVTSLNTLVSWRRNLRTILSRLNEIYGEPLIGLAGLPPMHGFPLLPEPLRTQVGNRSVAVDGVGRKVVAEFANVVHVPVEFELTRDRFADDGYHPSEFGYVEFGQVMSDALLHLENLRDSTITSMFERIELHGYE